jgi:outer membrane protease
LCIIFCIIANDFYIVKINGIFILRKISVRKKKDELAYKSSNTRKANQLSWKIIHNTIIRSNNDQLNIYIKLKIE